MARRTLHARLRLVLSIAGLAAYGLAALAGYGLHGLVDHGHASACYGHGLECCLSAAVNSAVADDRSYDEAALSQSPDDCLVCSFLAQAQSSHFAEVEPSGCVPLADASVPVDSLVHALLANAPLARGPPPV
jgi:hypothetical protein